ncbi:MAG: peptidase C39 [Halomonadaceae bacterium]|nr:MAG: peptidase C39 [Halomonadaceae bacterium]
MKPCVLLGQHLLTLLGMLCCVSAAQGMTLPGMAGGHEVQVESLKALRFHSVVQQQYDYSCGSAALATLLSVYYQRPTTEVDAFDSMFRNGDQGLIRSQGFSMLDMKRYLALDQGLSADGFRLDLAELKALGVPAIAMIELQGYRHFVVIKGLRDGQVLVGDPALGLRSYSKGGFQRIRVNDILFIIRDRPDLAQQQFNNRATWGAVAQGPTDKAVARNSVAEFVLNLPGATQW